MNGFIAGLTGSAGVVSLTFFVIGPTLAYARIVPGLAGFMLFALGMIIGLVSGIAGLVQLTRTGMGTGAALGLLGVPAAAFLVYAIVSTRGAPAINDVSTDVVYPPPFVHASTLPENKGRDMAFPESFKEIIKSSYPDMQSLAMSATVDDVLARAMALAREEKGWEVTFTEITPKESIIEGYATTHVFGFVDDFVIRITKVQAGGCVVDMRSKSREGKGDLGANAERIRTFLTRLQSG